MAFGMSSRQTPSVLEQLLEEINFQRTKEMRQLLKDDSGGFVVLQGTTYWTDLFVRHFLFQEEQAIDCDDLLFFVRKKHVKGSSRYLPKFETEVDVFRKDSKKLPIGDPDIDWEETVYLNLIIHQFDYTLTLAICTRTSPKELQVLKRHSQKVYASPSRRKMDTKGDGEEITYPHICFMVDNFDEVFCDILVRDGEMVCVELVASDRCGTVQGVIFLGSIRYDALKKVYDARQSSLGTKVAQRMTFGLFSNSANTRCEFVRMKGPQGKGHAEMAVTRPKGSGVETPTSEPGFCATDMWDSDWEEDPDDFYVYRHQRRLSDPSANINTFYRGGWRARGSESGPGNKCRSENEGLDSMANGMAEIEAGDLRDEVRPAFFGRCCSSKSGRGCCASSTSWGDMSEVYQRDEDTANETPACLINVTPKKDNTKKNKPSKTCDLNKCTEEIELKDMSKDKIIQKSKILASPNRIALGKIVKGEAAAKSKPKKREDKSEFEIADCAISLNEDEASDRENNRSSTSKPKTAEKVGKMSELASDIITVRGKEELPCVEEIKTYSRQGSDFVEVTKTENSIKHPLAEEINGNDGDDEDDDAMPKLASRRGIRAYCTLPRGRRWGRGGYHWRGGGASPPKKTTPDGTNIYYWCDLSKKDNNELDDGAYNPLWTMRGFTQSFHFWKENKRQQSTPLNAFLTYVTLPWWSIAKDILDHREEPILTF